MCGGEDMILTLVPVLKASEELEINFTGRPQEVIP